MTKSYRFFAHFNRIAMQRGSPKVWTVHFRGQCIPAEHVVFMTPVTTQYRPHGPQPRATLRGAAAQVYWAGDSLVVSSKVVQP